MFLCRILNFVFCLFIISLYTSNLVAQNESSGDFLDKNLNLHKELAKLDSLYYHRVNTLVVNHLFMPVVFSGKVLPNNYEFTVSNKLYVNQLPMFDSKPVDLFDKEIYTLNLQKQAYKYLTLHDPFIIKYAKDLMPKDIPVTKEIRVKPRGIFQTEKQEDFYDPGSLEVKAPKFRYWIINYETSLHFSQNYISENWYKGGESNFNLMWINKFKHEYEKNKVKISNAIEYKLSIYTTPTDTLRPYRIGDDAFSIISSYGYRAIEKWYYSLSLDFRTQFFNNYYENKMLKSSSFLSPMGLNIGLGMEYKLNKTFTSDRYKKVDFSANISPFSYNMKYLMDDDVDKKRHGFEPGQNFIKNLGVKVISTLQFNINRSVAWNSKFYYFSNFEKVEAEFENTLNLCISRFFSTRIYFDVRFDDSVIKSNPSDSYFQYYEILSFGFNYKF